jgi:hypothetical protein
MTPLAWVDEFRDRPRGDNGQARTAGLLKTEERSIHFDLARERKFRRQINPLG